MAHLASMLNVILTGTSDMDPAHKTTTLILSHTLVVREPNVSCPRHAVLPTVHVCKQSPIAAEVTGPLSKKYTHIYTLFCKNYTTQPSTILTVVVVRFQRVLIQLLLSKYVIKGWTNFPPYLFSVHTLPWEYRVHVCRTAD